MSRFAELVFHVLAHVPGDAPASVFDPAYVAFVEKHAGPASSRPLGEDVLVLARAAQSHETLVQIQMLAWLWRGSVAVDARVLSELEVDDPVALAIVTRPGVVAIAEVLRAAAELETEVYASLPPPTFGREVLDQEIGRISRAAPHLSACTVECVRSLRLRGRVRGRAIWVGAPCSVVGPTPEHAAWQAAHEATVAEVSELARAAKIAHSHDGLEHAALVLLAERAERAGLAAPHRAWLSHLARLPAIE
ncbi:MAG: hypothetical protein ACXWP4_27485, partial [Polyangiales bacterium]